MASRAGPTPDRGCHCCPGVCPSCPARPAARRPRARYLRAPARPARRGRRPRPWALQPSARPQRGSRRNPALARPAGRKRHGRDHFRHRRQVGRVGDAASGGRAPPSRASGSPCRTPGPAPPASLPDVRSDRRRGADAGRGESGRERPAPSRTVLSPQKKRSLGKHRSLGAEPNLHGPGNSGWSGPSPPPRKGRGHLARVDGAVGGSGLAGSNLTSARRVERSRGCRFQETRTGQPCPSSAASPRSGWGSE